VIEELIPFGSPFYCLFLALLFFARGMDFLSTWIASPNLLLEANPIARRMGWKTGILVNFMICLAVAMWSLPAIIIITTSLLVAARNLQNAWLMRSLGEERYRGWVAERLRDTNLRLYLFCLLTEVALIASIGGTLVYFSDYVSRPDFLHLVPFAIGTGIITYALGVTVYTLLSLWRIRRLMS
jgi:hypothetical protein